LVAGVALVHLGLRRVAVVVLAAAQEIPEHPAVALLGKVTQVSKVPTTPMVVVAVLEKLAEPMVTGKVVMGFHHP